MSDISERLDTWQEGYDRGRADALSIARSIITSAPVPTHVEGPGYDYYADRFRESVLEKLKALDRGMDDG